MVTNFRKKKKTEKIFIIDFADSAEWWKRLENAFSFLMRSRREQKEELGIWSDNELLWKDPRRFVFNLKRETLIWAQTELICILRPFFRPYSWWVFVACDKLRHGWRAGILRPKHQLQVNYFAHMITLLLLAFVCMKFFFILVSILLLLCYLLI